MNKNTQNVLGITSIILALSPFTEQLKSVVICNLGGKQINAFIVYFIYAGFFVIFALIQFYLDAFFSNNSNSEKRIHYSKISSFIYHIILTIPLATIGNIVFYGIIQAFFSEKETQYNGILSLIIVFIVQMVLIMKQDYSLKFGKYHQSETCKDDILKLKQLSAFHLDNKNYSKTAITHYDISKSLLGQYNNRDLDQIKNLSITDLITDAYLEKKISINQKEKFHKIASIWDLSVHNAELNEEIDNIFLNESFIKKEIEFFENKKL